MIDEPSLFEQDLKRRKAEKQIQFDNELANILISNDSDKYIFSTTICNKMKIQATRTNLRKISRSAERLRRDRGLRIIASRDSKVGGYKIARKESEWLKYRKEAYKILRKGFYNLGVCTEKQAIRIIYQMNFQQQ